MTLAASIALLAFFADNTPEENRKLFGLWRTRHLLLAMVLAGSSVSMACAAVSKDALFGFICSMASVVAVFGVLELAGAIGLVSWGALLSPSANDFGARPAHSVHFTGTTYQDAASAWGLDATPIPFDYQTNALGYRNHPDLDEADVYLLGDSMLVSALVPFNETLVAGLQTALDRPVMQIALVATGPHLQQMYFRQAGLPLDGKLVVQFVFEGNDLLDTAYFRQVESGLDESSVDSQSMSLSRALVLLLQRVTQPVSGLASLQTCEIDEDLYTFSWIRQAFEGLDEEIPAMLTAMSRFAREVHNQGGQYAVVHIPKKLRVLGNFCDFPPGSRLVPLEAHLGNLPDHLREWSEREQIPYLDLTAALQAAANQGRIPWFWGDTHWNAAGQAAALEALLDWETLRNLQ